MNRQQHYAPALPHVCLGCGARVLTTPRDLCVALIAKLADSIRAGSAWLGQHDPADAAWDPDWRNIVFVELPTGQLSWHIHDSELPLFAFLKGRTGLAWDGHTTEEKYERVKAALRLRSVEFTP